jgi:quinol monooxygenase YgiN
MELFIFIPFRARPGQEDALAAALLEVLAPSREEPGCLSIHAFRSRADVTMGRTQSDGDENPH